MCRSELLSLKDIYPPFDDDVDFYVVNVNPADSLGDVITFGQNQGWTFPSAQPNRDMLSDFNITRQSTKIAFDGDGVIVYRDGFGAGDPDVWKQVLEDLSGQPASTAMVPSAPAPTAAPRVTPAPVASAPTAAPAPTVAPTPAATAPPPTAIPVREPTATAVPPPPTATVPPVPTATTPPPPPTPTATAIPPAPTATAVPPTPTAIPTPAPAVAVGSSVGERVPEFTLSLADGSTVSATSLIQAERPTFLFFFASF